jgi:hypothetical protein
LIYLTDIARQQLTSKGVKMHALTNNQAVKKDALIAGAAIRPGTGRARPIKTPAKEPKKRTRIARASS